jgi:hypothetical protein
MPTHYDLLECETCSGFTLVEHPDDQVDWPCAEVDFILFHMDRCHRHDGPPCHSIGHRAKSLDVHHMPADSEQMVHSKAILATLRCANCKVLFQKTPWPHVLEGTCKI